MLRGTEETDRGPCAETDGPAESMILTSNHHTAAVRGCRPALAYLFLLQTLKISLVSWSRKYAVSRPLEKWQGVGPRAYNERIYPLRPGINVLDSVRLVWEISFHQFQDNQLSDSPC